MKAWAHTCACVVFLSASGLHAVLGVKLSKLPLLKGMFEEESKQKMKLERTTLGAGANDLLNWLKTIPDLRAYVDTIKESSVTGAQLSPLTS